MSLARCSSFSSLKPVQRMIGISGLIEINSLASCSPVIFGIPLSLITRSNFDGLALKASKASGLLVRTVT